MPTMTRKQLAVEMNNTANGIMAVEWRRLTDKIDKRTKEVIEPAGTPRHMTFVPYRDNVKKHFEPAGGHFANAATEADAKAIKTMHQLMVVYPVEPTKDKGEEKRPPKAVPLREVYLFVCRGVEYRVVDDGGWQTQNI